MICSSSKSHHFLNIYILFKSNSMIYWTFLFPLKKNIFIFHIFYYDCRKLTNFIIYILDNLLLIRDSFKSKIWKKIYFKNKPFTQYIMYIYCILYDMYSRHDSLAHVKREIGTNLKAHLERVTARNCCGWKKNVGVFFVLTSFVDVQKAHFVVIYHIYLYRF